VNDFGTYAEVTFGNNGGICDSEDFI